MTSPEKSEVGIQPLQLTDKQILSMIWTKPRIVFRYIHEFHYDKYTYIILFVVAIGNAIERASTNRLGDGQSLIFVLLIAVVAGGIFGVMTYYIYAAVTSLVGYWMGGHANTKDILRVLAHAAIPLTLTLPIIAARIILFGKAMFEGDIDLDDYSSVTAAVYVISIVVQVGLVIWFLFLWIVGIAEVQGFSVGRSVGNWLLGALLFMVGLILIVMPFVILKQL